MDVFRFAWFAVRTFLGVVALVLAAEAAMWLLVKTHSMATANVDPDAALRGVISYSAPAIRHKDRRAPAVSFRSPSRPRPATESQP